MGRVLKIPPLFIFLLSFFPFPSSPFPLCTDLRAPSTLKGHLLFCAYNGSKVCCSPSQDLQLQRRFLAMNISGDPACASAVKSVLCATCDPFAAKLFRVAGSSEPRSVPILCNSTVSSFCSSVWQSCRDVPILNSPFAPALQSKAAIPWNATSSTLTDLWQSESIFCAAFGGPSDGGSLCLGGELPVPINRTSAPPVPPRGVCLEKIGNGMYLNMAPHPDGSDRAFFSSMAGKIWLATIPGHDSGEVLEIDESRPFVDLTDQVYLDTKLGMMGMAFHPDFARNGRFFASFNCDKEKSPGCGGRCACNSDVACDPSRLGSSEAGRVCRYHAVIAEYSANGTAASPSMAETARPNEVRRIFTLGLPSTDGHGGQILFGPGDGYLYVMMGDGSKGDPYNFAQNKKSLLGKIMRVDVDNLPSEEEIGKLARWGNYSVPQDNPYSEDKEMEPEIWAYGLRNPWRCSFDFERPSYFLCADVGQDRYEEVDIITKGGNYGWRVYEGPTPFVPQSSTPGGNTSTDSIDPIFPVAGYSHSEINKLGSAAISGGYFYRAPTDPCMYGSYLYADLYAKFIWAASESPESSGNFTPKGMPFSCAPDSPIKCNPVPNSSLPALEYIFSFGQDNKRDVYLLTQSGVYRVVRPSRCSYACSKEAVMTRSHHPSTAPSLGCSLHPYSVLVLFACAVALFFVVTL